MTTNVIPPSNLGGPATQLTSTTSNTIAPSTAVVALTITGAS
jgi:hypothetical protein